VTSHPTRDGRLRLRRFTRADIDLLVALDSDPESDAFHHLRRTHPSCDIRRRDPARWFALYESSPLLGYWAAEDRDGGGFLGWFLCVPTA